FLQSYDGDKPFYREVGFFSPHGPRYTPARFKDMYDWQKFQQPAEWANGFDDNAYTDEHMPQTPELKDGKLGWWQYNVRNYFAGLSHGDYHFGRVMDALQDSKFADNTIVVVITDHGFQLGPRNRFYKSTVWEQAAGVPIIIHDPESPARVIDDPVALLDIGPTVLDYAGVRGIRNCIGKSLRPQVDGASKPDRVIPTFRYDNISIRKGHYRMARYVDGSTQLFDLRTDIWNLNDLGPDDPAYEGMEQALIAAGEEYGMEHVLE
ncbi:MAG: sulfatase family protein, partial [Planktomarina sp.]